jgi:glutaminyl-peptide cyclotransferase
MTKYAADWTPPDYFCVSVKVSESSYRSPVKQVSMRIFWSSLVVSVLLSCGGSQEKKSASTAEKKIRTVPAFSADSAYHFVEQQVAFGPRVPNTRSHRETGDYLIRKLKDFGASVRAQEFQATSFDGHPLNLRNIIASFNPDVQKRILLASHWDTRPFADKDSNQEDLVFDGANDGASGVGVLLEIARQLGKMPPAAGIDLILFDGEDWGEKSNSAATPLPEGLESWWCLGSQYWAKHKGSYSAYYGILLDMVGAKGSRFYREGVSLNDAPKIVEKVWNTAEQLGYSSYFVKQNEGAIEDDHVYVNEVAKIPMIDIVHYQPGVGYFGDYHHSRKDNLSIISRETLGVVGNVLLHLVYQEE